MKKIIETCSHCGGRGAIPIGELFVTREMALDAGFPALEGQSLGIEWDECDNCDGAGYIITNAKGERLMDEE